MFIKNKFNHGKLDKASKKLIEHTNKINISDSEESCEEYTEKELYYIDKYKPMTLYRMEDQEIYDIIVKHNFNDVKIESEIHEFVKLINVKGDDYGWNIVDKGKSNFLNIFYFVFFIR